MPPIILSLDALMSRLAQLDNDSKPTSFYELFVLAEDFCKTTSAHSSVEGAHLRLWLRQIGYVAKVYSAYVYESSNKGFLNEPRRSRSPKINELDRALQTPKLRAHFLVLLVASSLASAARMLLSTNTRLGVAHIAWECLINTANFFPALAPLVIGCDFVNLRAINLNEAKRVAETLRAHGYEPILLWEACMTAEKEAWGAWFQAAQTEGPERLSLLKTAVHTLGSAVRYMLLTEGTRIPQTFYSLYEQASMTAILHKVAHKKLERLPTDVWADIHEEPDFDSPTGFFVFSEGILRKRRYVIDLPDISCLVHTLTYSAHQEWKNDPPSFVRRNIDNISTSLHAKRIQLQYDTMQSGLLDATFAAAGDRIKQQVGPIMKEMTPEAIAVLIVEGAHLPAIATPVFTLFFRRIYRFVQRDPSADDSRTFDS